MAWRAMPSRAVVFSEHEPQPRQELRELSAYRFPDDLMIDIEIRVDQPIAHRHDQRPWNVSGGFAGRKGDPARGLANDLDRTHKRKNQHAVAVEIAAAAARDEIAGCFRGFDHVEKPDP